MLLVGGHFPSTADNLVWAGILGESMMPGTVQSSKAPWRLSPKVLRTRLGHDTSGRAQNKLFRVGAGVRSAYMPYLWGGDDDVWTSAPRSTGVQDRILRMLAGPRSRAKILPDAIWEKQNAYRRPFAGIEDRGFALGAARIARLSQATVLPFVAVHGPEPLTVRIDWGVPITPAPVDDETEDHAVIDHVLDFIEAGVARYPGDYSLSIGWDRWEPDHRSKP